MFFRTDMAVERRDLYKAANKIEEEIDGIECEYSTFDSAQKDVLKTLCKKYNKYMSGGSDYHADFKLPASEESVQTTVKIPAITGKHTLALAWYGKFETASVQEFAFSKEN